MKLPDVAEDCAAALRALKHVRIAVVQAESGALDQAFLSPSGENVLIRCAARMTTADLEALETIASQGPFDRIVYVVNDGPCRPGAGFDSVEKNELATRLPQLLGG